MMMADNTLDNFNKYAMGKVCLVSLTEMCTWDSGSKISLVEMDFMFMLLEINIRASFNKEKKVAEEFILINLEQNMTDNGKKIKNMVLEYFIIRALKNMKEIGLMGRSVARGLFIMLTEINTMDSG